MDQPPAPPPVSPPPPAEPPRRSRRKFRFACLFLAILLLLGGGYWWYSSRPPAPPLIPDSIDPVLHEALEQARDRVLREPRSAATWGKLGMVFHANGLPDPAASCYAQAEELDATDARWPYYRGLLLRSEPAAALPHLRRAAEHAGADDQEIRLRLADTLMELNRDREAEEIYRDLLRRHPRLFPAQLALGTMACTRRRFAESLPYLRNAAESPQTKKVAYSLLATVYTRLGHPAEAAQAQAWATSLPLTPEPVEPLRKAVTDLATGKKDRLARIERRLAQGRFAEALQAAEELAQENPDDLWAADTLVRALYTSGDSRRARQVIERTVTRWPRHSPFYFYLGSIEFREGEALVQRQASEAEVRAAFLAAAAHFQKVIAIKQDDASAYYNLGLSFRYAGEEASAARAFQKALDIRPDYADPHARLAEWLLKQGDPAGAWAHIHSAFRLTPPNEPVPLLAVVLAGSWFW
jgi:tetratricopeptide (TPR) repeat protein